MPFAVSSFVHSDSTPLSRRWPDPHSRTIARANFDIPSRAHHMNTTAETIDGMKVGIVGATGLVGEFIIASLAERKFPIRLLRLFASERSAGKRLRWKDTQIVVEDAATADYTGLDIVFFSAGARDLALRLAPRSWPRPAPSSSTTRPLGACDPERAARRCRGRTRRTSPGFPRASSPTRTAPPWPRCRCSSRCTMRPCLRRLVVSTYQAVSGGGRRGRPGATEARCRRVAANAAMLVRDGSARGCFRRR